MLDAARVVEELYTNYGLPPPRPEQHLREDDADFVAGRVEIFRAVGGDRETLIAASRYFGENLRRAAESQVRFFRARLIYPLLAAGTPPGEVLDAIAPVSANFQVALVEKARRGSRTTLDRARCSSARR